MVFTVSILFNYFSQLLKLHGLSDKNPRNVASKLGVNPFFVNDYITASRHYPMRQVSKVIGVIREFDLKSKGVNANATPQGDLLKEMLVKIMG